MTATPRPTPADLQTWRREAQDYLDNGYYEGKAPRFATRILALLDALTAAEQRELELLKEQTAWRLHRDVAESIAKYWMDKDDAAGNEIAQLRAALTAKDEALADAADCKHYVTTLVVKNNLWRDGMDAREMVYALAFANDKATEEALTRADHQEAESARLTFERDDLAREVSRRIDENIVSMHEHARLTAQVTELQRQLAEADAGDDIRAFERTVKEQSDRNVTLTAQVEALQTARDVSEARETAYRQRVGTAEVALHTAERRADDAEAQVTRLTEQLDRIAPMVCPECGPHVRVDEDGCCATCGADAALAPTTPPATHICGDPAASCDSECAARAYTATPRRGRHPQGKGRSDAMAQEGPPPS